MNENRSLSVPRTSSLPFTSRKPEVAGAPWEVPLLNRSGRSRAVVPLLGENRSRTSLYSEVGGGVPRGDHHRDAIARRHADEAADAENAHVHETRWPVAGVWLPCQSKRARQASAICRVEQALPELGALHGVHVVRAEGAQEIRELIQGEAV